MTVTNITGWLGLLLVLIFLCFALSLGAVSLAADTSGSDFKLFHLGNNNQVTFVGVARGGATLHWQKTNRMGSFKANAKVGFRMLEDQTTLLQSIRYWKGQDFDADTRVIVTESSTWEFNVVRLIGSLLAICLILAVMPPVWSKIVHSVNSISKVLSPIRKPGFEVEVRKLDV